MDLRGGKDLKKLFITGLFVLIPITVTISIMFWLFNTIDSIFREPLETLFGVHLIGVGFVLTILLVFIAGIVASNYLGKKLIAIRSEERRVGKECI